MGIPFKGSKPFGKDPDPFLIETKGKKKVLPSHNLQSPSKRHIGPFVIIEDKHHNQPWLRSRHPVKGVPGGLPSMPGNQNDLISSHATNLHVSLSPREPSPTLHDSHDLSPIGGCLEHFADKWDLITTDRWVLETVRLGYALELCSFLGTNSCRYADPPAR